LFTYIGKPILSKVVAYEKHLTVAKPEDQSVELGFIESVLAINEKANSQSWAVAESKQL